MLLGLIHHIKKGMKIYFCHREMTHLMKSGIDDIKSVLDHYYPWILHSSSFTVMLKLGGVGCFIISTGK